MVKIQVDQVCMLRGLWLILDPELLIDKLHRPLCIVPLYYRIFHPKTIYDYHKSPPQVV